MTENRQQSWISSVGLSKKLDGYFASMPAEILAADDDENIRETIGVALSAELDVETVKWSREADG